MQLSDYISLASLAVSIITLVISLATLCVAILAIRSATKSFKRTITLQTEMFISGAYESYMKTMLSQAEDQKRNAKTRFLMAIDLYCKYVVNKHLDKTLSDDNLRFYEGIILMFKDVIKENIQDYNNIADYAKKYNISLE